MKKSEIVLINHQGLKLVAGIQVQTPTPPIGLAYIGSYIKKHGYDYTAIDACGEALSQVRKVEPDSDLMIQGLTSKEVINKVPKHNITIVIGDCNAHIGKDDARYTYTMKQLIRTESYC